MLTTDSLVLISNTLDSASIDLSNNLFIMMEETTMLVVASFIMILAICLLGLFVHLVRAAITDRKTAITSLNAIQQKIREMEHRDDRAFKDFGVLFWRCRSILAPKKIRSNDHGAQTDPEQKDLGQCVDKEDTATQTFSESDQSFQRTESLTPQTPATEEGTNLQRELATMPCSLPPLLVKPALSSDIVISVGNLKDPTTEETAAKSNTDDAEQVHISNTCSLPPLMVRPALSSDVVIPINEEM